MTWGRFVHPDEVHALRARLSPAFDACQHAPHLRDAWRAYCAEAVGWFDAPERLEEGLDLEAALALAQGPAGAPDAGTHDTGTILGAWSVAELEDLIAAQRYQLGELDAAKPCPAWAAADPQGYGAWAADVYDASQVMRMAIDNAQQVVDMTPEALRDVMPALAAWDHLIDAAKPFHDLAARFDKAGFCKWPDMGGMPQPKAKDLDLRAFNWTGDAMHEFEAAADAAKTAVPWVGIAAVAALGLVVLLRVSR